MADATTSPAAHEIVASRRCSSRSERREHCSDPARRPDLRGPAGRLGLRDPAGGAGDTSRAGSADRASGPGRARGACRTGRACWACWGPAGPATPRSPCGTRSARGGRRFGRTLLALEAPRQSEGDHARQNRAGCPPVSFPLARLGASSVPCCTLSLSGRSPSQCTKIAAAVDQNGILHDLGRWRLT